MKWEKTSAVAEIVSSIAILVTLGYLAVQTQQTNNSLIANSRGATMLADLSFLGELFEHPEINLFLGIGAGSGDVRGDEATVFTDADYVRLDTHLTQYLRIREFAWFQLQNGILDQATFDAYISPTAYIFSQERAKPI